VPARPIRDISHVENGKIDLINILIQKNARAPC
jgi:hypothetical protein